MRRRAFLAFGAVAAVFPPVAARAQQRAMPVIGYLGTAAPSESAPYVAALLQGLRESGFVEGQNLAIESRWAEGRYERLPSLAAELVDRKVDVILTGSGAPAALAAKSATSVIPIIFLTGDAVADGLVATLAQPGGNLTGVSSLSTDLTAKRLELLCELVPEIRLIALLVNPSNPNAEPVIRDLQEAAV